MSLNPHLLFTVTSDKTWRAAKGRRKQALETSTLDANEKKKNWNEKGKEMALEEIKRERMVIIKVKPFKYKTVMKIKGSLCRTLWNKHQEMSTCHILTTH